QLRTHWSRSAAVFFPFAASAFAASIPSQKMKTQRELKIDAYIQQHPDAKHDGPRPVFYHGKIHALDVFRLPTKLLIFNVGNGRFAAELMAEEKRLGRTFDTTKPEDIKVISRLLLEQNLDET